MGVREWKRQNDAHSSRMNMGMVMVLMWNEMEVESNPHPHKILYASKLKYE